MEPCVLHDDGRPGSRNALFRRRAQEPGDQTSRGTGDEQNEDGQGRRAQPYVRFRSTPFVEEEEPGTMPQITPNGEMVSVGMIHRDERRDDLDTGRWSRRDRA